MLVLSARRPRRHVLSVLAVLALLLAAPAAFARSHVSIGIALPGLGISYSDYGHRGHGWGGHVSTYPAYGYGYGYGYAPRPVYYPAPYYHDRHYRPSRVVYYDRHDGRRYDRHVRRHDDHRYHDRRDGRRDHRGGYYDRGR